MNMKCRVCGAEDIIETYYVRDYFIGGKNKYKYILCSRCRSLSLIDIPKNMDDLYKNYYSFETPKKVSLCKLIIYKYILKSSNLLSRVLSKRLQDQDDLPIKSLSKINLNKENSILDVGCGSGSLLKLLNKMGYKNCIGIDKFLKKNIIYPSGLEIQKKDIFSFEEGVKFDVIMLHHVFEHFSNLKEVLIQINKLLSKNGVCIIRIPDVDSFSFFRYKKNWFSIHAPFHVSLPSKTGMKQLINKTGLKIERFMGEQLLEFFFYSMGYELGISDYAEYGNRNFIEKYGVNKIPPLHIKNEIKDAKQRVKQVQKNDLCDWAVYYLKKEI